MPYHLLLGKSLPYCQAPINTVVAVRDYCRKNQIPVPLCGYQSEESAEAAAAIIRKAAPGRTVIIAEGHCPAS